MQLGKPSPLPTNLMDTPMVEIQLPYAPLIFSRGQTHVPCRQPGWLIGALPMCESEAKWAENHEALFNYTG